MKALNIEICKYISENWIGGSSNRFFAIEHDIDEKTVRQIKYAEEEAYSMTLETLEKICKARGITLEAFFRLIKR